MKKSFYTLSFLILLLVGVSCSDDAPGKEQANTLSARINGELWEPEKIYTQKAVGENGPLTIIGEGGGYTLKLILRGVDGTGIYVFNTSRHAEVTFGQTDYTTLDLQDAGSIDVSSFEENRIEGTFSFDAQWLSSNNNLEVREGSFSVFYY